MIHAIRILIVLLPIMNWAHANNWAEFRGPNRMGIAPSGSDHVPVEWSDTKNILWKCELPGRGASSPTIWSNNIYLTAFTGYGMVKNDPHRNIPNLVRHLLCIDRLSGKVRWKIDLSSGQTHEHGSSDFLYLHGYASSTPLADEQAVYIYLGKGGVVAHDHSGRELWRAVTGKRDHNWGSASSPIGFENLIIVHADPEAESVLALDKKTGRQVWKTPTGKGDSWSTPLIVSIGNRKELMVHHSTAHITGTGVSKVAGLDPRNGQTLWEASVLKDYLCPSPVAVDGVVYWLAYQQGAAVRAGGSGDVTASHVLWTAPRGSEICSPIVHEGHLYWAHEGNGTVYCVNAKTGAVVYQERLQPTPGRIYASGVLAGGRIYYISREKGAYVVEAKPQFRLLAHNTLASDTSVFNATPAISRNQLFLRSDRALYCVGNK